jgi:hypothetical protein
VPSATAEHQAIESALREERELVLSLGGFALELAGGVIVLNERVPVPRFNFVQYIRIHRNRQSSFLEHALDYYFQRALRPSIRVEKPVPEFLDASLRQFGFRPTPESWSLLFHRGRRAPRSTNSGYVVRPATADELPFIARFWTADSEREEFLRALAVALEHPNPEEGLVPALALRDGLPASAALLHRFRSSVGIHGVVTQPSERGQGAATALVAGLLDQPLVPTEAAPFSMWSASPRLDRRLEMLGFDVAMRYTIYELPKEAELSLPPPGPPTPPRWRPPRRKSESLA